MIWILRLFFLVVLGSMLAVTTWASLRGALFAIPREVWTHPWFVATLVDAYWAFLAFYAWAAWKEQATVARILWLVTTLALGSIAIAVYFLRETFSLSPRDNLALVFTRRNPGRVLLPAVLVAGSVAAYLLA